MKEAKNDPIKKADLIRDMVVSISKIPDRIQREVYTQECARIMDISEQVLVSTLAQLIQKDLTEANKKQKQEQKPFEVVRNQNPKNTGFSGGDPEDPRNGPPEDYPGDMGYQEQQQAEKIDVLYRLERKVIEILLLYGDKTEEFEDVLLKDNEEGEVVMVSEKREYKVFQRIYLSLQEDEVELSNNLFKDIFTDLIGYYNQNEKFNLEQYLMRLQPDFAQEVTDILMEDERLALHNWEGQNIFSKMKHETIAQYVTETIMSMRWFLVDRIIEELKSSIQPDNSDNTELLSMVVDYSKLVNSFSKKLGRVMSRYH
jgi:DNA primase